MRRAAGVLTDEGSSPFLVCSRLRPMFHSCRFTAPLRGVAFFSGGELLLRAGVWLAAVVGAFPKRFASGARTVALGIS